MSGMERPEEVVDWSHVEALAEVTAERDAARALAVRLEQELAQAERQLGLYKQLFRDSSEFEYGQGLLVGEEPDVFELHKGPWSEPRALDEGYWPMIRSVGRWVVNGPQS